MNKIKIIREALRLTQSQFASMLNVTIATVSRWENSHRAPSKLAEDKILFMLQKISNTQKKIEHAKKIEHEPRTY